MVWDYCCCWRPGKREDGPDSCPVLPVAATTSNVASSHLRGPSPHPVRPDSLEMTIRQPVAVAASDQKSPRESKNHPSTANDDQPDLRTLTQQHTQPATSADRIYSLSVAQDQSHVIQGDVVHNHYYPVPGAARQLPESIPLEWRLTNRYDLLVESLKFARINARALNVEEAAEETCRWLLSHESFYNWSTDVDLDSQHGLLWIKGKPGSGKSTIMKFLLEQTSKQNNTVTISYFFNARALTELEKSSQGLYQSLAYQLLTNIPPSCAEFAARFWTKVTSDTVELWSAAELQSFITAVLVNPNRPPVNIFIDALDEGSEADVRRFVGYLEQLVGRCRSNPTRLRICLSSRHYPHITIKYGRQLVLDKEPDHDGDIQKFVQKTLVVDSSTLRDDVCKKSAGIFLWVVLTVPMLNTEFDQGADLSALEVILGQLPTNLNELFESILRASRTGIEDCVNLLQWVLFSLEPLSPQDLYVALHYSRETPPSKLSTVPDDETIHRYLLHRSRGLVEAVKTGDKLLMQFIHETVRTFLLGPNGIQKSMPELAGKLEGQSHERLKRACFQFLKHNKTGFEAILQQTTGSIHHYSAASTVQLFWPGFGGHDNYDSFPPFVECVLQMLSHSDLAQGFDIAQKDWMQDLSSTEELQVWCKFYICSLDSDPWGIMPQNKISLIAVLVHLRLLNLLNHLLQYGPDSGAVTNSDVTTALTIACANADDTIMDIIITEICPQFTLPYYDRTRTLRKPALESLFERGVYINHWILHVNQAVWLFDITEEDAIQRIPSWRRSPLDYIRLLELGVKPGSCDQEGLALCSLPLHARLTKEEISGLDIYEAESDSSALKEGISFALQAACLGNAGHESANIELLLEAGADPNVQGGRFGNALQAACSHSNQVTALELATKLLHAGAKVNATGGLWHTALQAACARGHFEVVGMLLANGADVNVVGGQANTALEALCRFRLDPTRPSDVAAVPVRQRQILRNFEIEKLMRLLLEIAEGGDFEKAAPLIDAGSRYGEKWTYLLRAVRAAVLARDGELVSLLSKNYDELAYGVYAPGGPENDSPYEHVRQRLGELVDWPPVGDLRAMTRSAEERRVNDEHAAHLEESATNKPQDARNAQHNDDATDIDEASNVESNCEGDIRKSEDQFETYSRFTKPNLKVDELEVKLHSNGAGVRRLPLPYFVSNINQVCSSSGLRVVPARKNQAQLEDFRQDLQRSRSSYAVVAGQIRRHQHVMDHCLSSFAHRSPNSNAEGAVLSFTSVFSIHTLGIIVMKLNMSYKFNLPLDVSRLENDRLRLLPIEDNLEVWAEQWVRDADKNPHVYDHLTFGPYRDAAEFVSVHNEYVRHDEKVLMLAIILKAGAVVRKDIVTGEVVTFDVTDDTFAGISGVIGDPENATADLGALLLTRFHRTFVGTNANALLLHHLLDPPASRGLGLRRVQWQANADNEASVNMAKRLGFQLEGIIRWQQILPINKIGTRGAGIDTKDLPKVGWDGRQWGPGRHTAMLSLCWDDWVAGGSEHVDGLLRR